MLHLIMDYWRIDNLTRFYFNSLDKWYKNALSKKEASPDEVVEALDKCLSAHEEYKKFIHMLGRPMPPKREAFVQKANAMRERYAQTQKVKEDKESLERINVFFAQPKEENESLERINAFFA